MSVASLIDSVSRTQLLLMHRGKIGSLEEARKWREVSRIHIHLGDDDRDSEFACAAALTAVTLAVRAECVVTYSLGGARSPEHFGKLEVELAALGASRSAIPRDAVLIGIGETPSVRNSGIPAIQLTWDGWVGAVRPFGTRLPERSGCILASIASAALGVSEAFHHFIGHLDAGWRDVTLSLWKPFASDLFEDVGPILTYLPEQWALIGLGHLGQAFAWCISSLPYVKGDGELWLFDDATISAANVSTGVLTSPSDVQVPPLRKARVVGSALESKGFRTRLVEMRLPLRFTREPNHPSVALVGVDNLDLRKKLSDIDWPLCVDVGLGSTPSSFNTLGMHVFPGPQLSTEVVGWNSPAPPATEADLPAAFTQILNDTQDQCGVLMLAERAVATAFVGVIAACLAVADPLSRVNGGSGIGALSLALDAPILRGTYSQSRVTREIPTVTSRFEFR
jgi:hypothetical protein